MPTLEFARNSQMPVAELRLRNSGNSAIVASVTTYSLTFKAFNGSELLLL